MQRKKNIFKAAHQLVQRKKNIFKATPAGAKGFPPYFRSVGNVDFYGPGRSEDGAEENQQRQNIRCWKVLCPDPSCISSEIKIENWKLKIKKLS